MPTELRKLKDRKRKERTRKALIDAAKRIFIRNGYHSTLISDIVAEAGVGQGTFYRNFKDKREVYEALIEDFISDLLEQFSEMKIKPPTNIHEYRQSSLNALDRMAEYIENHREMALLLLRETQAIDRSFEETMELIYKQFAGVAKYHLDRAIAMGFARPCHSEIVAEALVGIGWRMINAWANNRLPETSLIELISEVSDFAFMGFGIRDAKKLIEKQESFST